jgi:hypothetical protein
MFTKYMSRKSSEKGGNILYNEMEFYLVILRIYLLQEDFSGLALLFHPMP